MGKLTAADLDRVSNFPQLVSLLRDKLEWPIDGDYDFEDVVFEYEASELFLKKDEVAKIREIHQLRPLVTSQPWGVFFISLEDKALPVTVLRRILKALILNRRGQAKTADRQAWHLNDLIFAASFGKSGARELAFIHFSDGKTAGDLPVMKVLGWNARDTVLKHDYVAATLRDKLAWPDDPEDAEAWRATWASAFELRLNETIRTSEDLAVRLAELASDIRARVNQLLKAEDQTGPMTTMLAAFRKNLIHDLDADGFADMFAQTIAYGMLAARISRPAGIIADNLADMVPKTNPFLKELFGNFLKIGGRDKRTGLDFDELGVRDIVDMLNDADMEAVKRDFGNRNPKKDPVIHFYEDFIAEYDRAQKVDAGIFYTPPAVVGFIVRGVDEMLRTEFGLPLGLADTSTWAEVAVRNDRITIPAHVKPDAPFVQILDPATGTGTFLVEVIDLIHKRMVDHWKGQGKSGAEIKAAWNAYVPAYLLPRLTAFELKMAAYAIAHMKVGLKLSETGYTFGSEERLHVLLTNSLQPPTELDLEERMRLEAMAHEAERANLAKEKTPFTVVIGNPPYKGHSMNPSKVKGKLTFAGEIIQRFFQVRGEPLGEKNPKWLNNDYVKFIALAMRYIERTGVGVFGYITSNSWLDSPTFRGVRIELTDAFSTVKIIDLHGNIKKQEIGPDGSRDEGVFSIEEGTNITLAAKKLKGPKVFQIDLMGKLGDGDSDDGKLRWLETRSAGDVIFEIQPSPPFFVLTKADFTRGGEYTCFGLITEIQRVFSLGSLTKRDQLAVDFDETSLLKKIEAFRTDSGPLEEIAERYGVRVSDNDGWSILEARRLLDAVRNNMSALIAQELFRPFDVRSKIVHEKLIARPNNRVLSNVGPDAPALVLVRQLANFPFDHVFVTDRRADQHVISVRTKEGGVVLPLWLKPSSGEAHRRPNIDRAWALGFGKSLGLTYEDGIPRGEQKNFGPDFQRQKAEQLALLDTPWDGRGDLQKIIGPRDLFDYIYAVLHSPGYRSRYAEFLKSDFPRIPTPKDRPTFADLVALGRQLVALHLLRPDEAPILEAPGIRFAGTGEARVERGYPNYENGKVMINGSRWFEDVPKATWEFHVGGYRVCEKWLKDRAGKGGKKPSPGRILTDQDILHYRRAVLALTETRRLMAEIDAVIEKHGGWPGAFKVAD